jgi:adiponectin receptor
MSQRRTAATKNTFDSMNSNNSYVNPGSQVKPAANGSHPTSSLLGPSKHTVTWKQLPEWLQDNAYITAGYRPQLDSYVKCAKSVFYLHNEFGK